MANRNIDGGYAWVIAFACFWNFFSATAIFRCSGIIYAKIINVYGITREEATWPFTLSYSMFNVGIFLLGIFKKSFSIRTEGIIGVAMSVLGILCCYFAKNIVMLAIFYGVINGLGIGLINGTSFIITCEYFNQYRTVATGLLYGGASLGCLYLPPLIDYLINNYGLRGSFFLLSGISLQAMIGVSLYRSPPQQDQIAKKESRKKKNYDTIQKLNQEDERSAHLQTVLNSLKQQFSIFTYPMFYLIWWTFFVFFFCYTNFLTTIVDFSKSQGISEVKSIFLISIFFISDIVGRLLIGWVLDFGIVRRKTALLLLFLLLGTFSFMMTLFNSYIVLSVLTAFYGIWSAAVMTNWSVVLAEYFGLEKLPPAMGITSLLNSVGYVWSPSIVGYFKDTMGSYSLLFYTFGGLQFSAAACWLLEPVFMKIQNKNLTESTRL